MTINPKILWNAFLAGLSYAPVTIKLTIIVLIFATIIGGLVAIVRFYKVPVLSQIFAFLITTYQGVPVMVALVLFNLIFLTQYQSFAAFFHIHKDISQVNVIYVAYLVLILSESCFISETIRGALNGIDKSQFEAGYTIGLTKRQTFVRIIIPQIIPTLIPMIMNQVVGTIKGSNLISQIGVTEVMVAALVPCVATYSYLEGYLAAALVYWLITIMFEIIFKIIEKKSGKFRKAAVQ